MLQNLWIPVSVAVALVLAPLAHAQPERYELGRHLKAFEAAWEKHDDLAARRRALARLPKLTTQFFSGQLGEAGRTLDLAAFALQTDAAPATGRQWAWSLYAAPETRIVDGSATELDVTVQPFYPVRGDLPKGLELQLWFTNKHVVTVKPETFPLTVKVPLPPLGDARGLDRRLYFLVDGTRELRPAAVGVAQVADLAKRVERLTATTAGPPATIEQATARARAEAIRAGMGGGKKPPAVPDTDLPYAGLLANAEAMLDGKPFFTAARHGQFWLSIPVSERSAVPCRVYVPKGLDRAKPVPVVFALHGAGADENLFFEGYGAGQIVRECERRGWVLVAPRSGLDFGEGPPVAKLREALGERYPLDPKRVFVVGHSMGAVQSLGQATKGKLAAVAVLGGGRAVADPKAFIDLPTFIGVGDQDALALAGVRSLNKSLAAGGAKAVTYREYPGVEHLTVVREALPEAFETFDRAAKK